MMDYNHCSPVAIRGEGNFRIRLTFTVDESFRENTFRYFISVHPRIRQCFKLDNGKKYALCVNLSHKKDFDAFHDDLIRKVPGIAAINKAVIANILKH